MRRISPALVALWMVKFCGSSCVGASDANGLEQEDNLGQRSNGQATADSKPTVDLSLVTEYYAYAGEWSHFDDIIYLASGHLFNSLVDEPSARGFFVEDTLSAAYKHIDVDLSFWRGSDHVTASAVYPYGGPSAPTITINNTIRDDNSVLGGKIRYTLGSNRSFYVCLGVLADKTSTTVTGQYTVGGVAVSAPFQWFAEKLPLGYYSTFGMGWGTGLVLGGGYYFTARVEAAGLYATGGAILRASSFVQEPVSGASAAPPDDGGSAGFGLQASMRMGVSKPVGHRDVISLLVGAEAWDSSHSHAMMISRLTGGAIGVQFRHFFW